MSAAFISAAAYWVMFFAAGNFVVSTNDIILSYLLYGYVVAWASNPTAYERIPRRKVVPIRLAVSCHWVEFLCKFEWICYGSHIHCAFHRLDDQNTNIIVHNFNYIDDHIRGFIIFSEE